MIFYLFLLPVIHLGKAKLTESFAKSENSQKSDGQYCVCVPYWQCKNNYSGFTEDGANIIDIRKRQSTDACVGDLDVCCHTECGKRGSSDLDVTNRKLFGSQILGNNDKAEFAEFPWMLALLENKVYLCGASLIHPQVAVTAAHCVVYKTDIVVRAGEWDWAVTTEPFPHQERTVKQFIFHPLYHPASLRNDVALLVLRSPFTLSVNVGLICLPQQNSRPNKENCIATGWGNRGGQYQTTLKKMELGIVPRECCLLSLRIARLGPYFNLHNSFICAGGETDTCEGDGGGPLICPIDGDPEKYEQVGIVSWGLVDGGWNTPGVYVNLGQFRDWIDIKMNSLNFNSNSYKY